MVIDHLIAEDKIESIFGLSNKTECGLGLQPGSRYSGILKGHFSDWAGPTNNTNRCSKCLAKIRKNISSVPLLSTAIVGSREIPHDNKLLLQLETIFKDWFKDSLEIVSGGARGADYLGKALSKELDEVDYKEFPADWNNLGRKAGIIRNTPIAERVHNALIISNGSEVKEKSGTADVLGKLLNGNKSCLHVAYVEEGLKVVGLWRPWLKDFHGGMYLKF